MDKWMQEIGMALQGPYSQLMHESKYAIEAIGSTISCAAEPVPSIPGHRRFRGTSLGNGFLDCRKVKVEPGHHSLSQGEREAF